MDLFQLWYTLQGLIANLIDWLRPGRSVTQEPVEGPKCVIIHGPGGTSKLRLCTLPGVATKGYNVGAHASDICVKTLEDVPPNCMIVAVSHFAVNYADICVRWGLYESAIKIVGWPIVPGFDVSGKVTHCGADVRKFRVGDEVVGVTFFGGYSSHVCIPEAQVMKRAAKMSGEEAAALPAVSTTAYHAIRLAGLHDCSNKRALVHSAAGGVGCALVQILKHLNHNVTGVIGLEAKRKTVAESGADSILLKTALPKNDNDELYDAVFDANGVESLAWSYAHLRKNGRLVVYGFHTNLPKQSSLGPMEWIYMLRRMIATPRFDPMDLTLRSKAVLGFNLSFFADDAELIAEYLSKLVDLTAKGVLRVPTTVLPMEKVGAAHDFLSSGKSIGKIIIKV